MRKRTGILGFILVLTACSTADDPNAGRQTARAGNSADTEDRAAWSILGRTSDLQHSSPLSEINSENVQQLGLLWYADIPSLDGLVGNPLVQDGIVYQSGPMGRIYANDVRTGKELWTFAANPQFLGSSLATFWSLRYNRGVALSGDNVIVATGDCRLIAVNRKTGEQAWEAVSCDRTEMYGITGAPRVGGGMVFIGNNCIDSGIGRGFIDAFDAKSGAKRWRFYTVPNDPAKGQENAALEMAAKTWGTNWYEKAHGCASVWDAITYDAKLNLVYLGTAGPAPWSPADRAADAGDELFTNSIVALKADTGEYVWHYKTTPNDAWNFDATMHIMIAELPIDGTPRRVVMTAPKNGFFYVLDAATGKFISANNFTPLNWASHIDAKTGRPVTLPDARYWERPGEATVVSPGPLGAHNWQAMSYNGSTGLVYLPVIVAPTKMAVDPQAQVGGMRFDMNYGLSSKDPKWRAYGELVAWDPVKQEARWRAERTLPMNGGTLTTAGNLVFQGTADGRFDAFAADTGKLVWSFDVGSSVQAAPTTVEIDGKQIVLVSVGNPGSAAVGSIPSRLSATPKTRGPARLLAFALGRSETLPPVIAIPFAQPPRPKQAKGLAKRGGILFEQNFCVDCHGPDVVAAGGSVPDLRRSTAQTHDIFGGIVIGGLKQGTGMPAYPDISAEDLRAIQAYIINEAWKAHEAH